VLSGIDDSNGPDVPVFGALPRTLKRLTLRTVVPVSEFPAMAKKCAHKLPDLERFIVVAPTTVYRGVHEYFGVGLQESIERAWQTSDIVS
jgi:hypothetical protein